VFNAWSPAGGTALGSGRNLKRCGLGGRRRSLGVCFWRGHLVPYLFLSVSWPPWGEQPLLQDSAPCPLSIFCLTSDPKQWTQPTLETVSQNKSLLLDRLSGICHTDKKLTSTRYTEQSHFLGIYPEELKSQSQKNSYTPMFIKALFTQSRERKSPNVHWQMGKKYIHTVECCSALKRKSTICDNVDRPRGQYRNPQPTWFLFDEALNRAELIQVNNRIGDIGIEG
jgi:hypothetical protein